MQCCIYELCECTNHPRKNMPTHVYNLIWNKTRDTMICLNQLQYRKFEWEIKNLSWSNTRGKTICPGSWGGEATVSSSCYLVSDNTSNVTVLTTQHPLMEERTWGARLFKVNPQYLIYQCILHHTELSQRDQWSTLKSSNNKHTRWMLGFGAFLWAAKGCL